MNNNYLFAIWSRYPDNYFYIENLLKYLKKKKIKSHFIFQKSEYRSKISSKDILIKSSRYSILNKIKLIYFNILIIFFAFKLNPRKIILFNKHSLLSVIILKFFFKRRIIYHNFDYENNYKNLFNKILHKIELSMSNYVNKIFISNNERAKIFIRDSKIKKSKVIPVFNCLSKFDFMNIKKKKMKKKILFRIGSIGPGHSLLTIMKSMNYLNDNFHLILCGQIVDEAYYLKMKKVIRKYDLEKKITIKINTPKNIWKQILISSHVGIALYEKTNLSHKLMGLASQKINAYIAAGIPLILPIEKQYLNLNKKIKNCILVNNNDAHDMAKKINNLFLKKSFYKNLCKNSKIAFENYYNFENQLKYIDKTLF